MYPYSIIEVPIVKIYEADRFRSNKSLFEHRLVQYYFGQMLHRYH